jgi:hypothetical protein
MAPIHFAGKKIRPHSRLASGHNKRGAGRIGIFGVRVKHLPLSPRGKDLRFIPQYLRAVRLIWINLRRH